MSHEITAEHDYQIPSDEDFNQGGGEIRFENDRLNSSRKSRIIRGFMGIAALGVPAAGIALLLDNASSHAQTADHQAVAQPSLLSIPNLDHQLVLNSSQLNAIRGGGLNLDTIAAATPTPLDWRCDPISFLRSTSFIVTRQDPTTLENKQIRVFWGIDNAQHGDPGQNNRGIPIIGTSSVCENDTYITLWQIDYPSYNRTGFIEIDGAPVVDTNRNRAYVPVGIQPRGNTYILDGGQMLLDISNPRNLTTRSKVTSTGIDNIETDGNFTTSRMVNFNGQDCVLRSIPNAKLSSQRGDYRLCPDNNGTFTTGSWIKISGFETSTPTVTATRTATSTATPTVSTGSQVRAVSLAENPIEFKWQNMTNTAVTPLFRLRGSRFEHLATLPATTSSFRDNTNFGQGEFVCYTRLSVGFAGENLGLSPFLCLITGTKSVTGSPAGVIVSLENTNMARVSFIPNPLNPAETKALLKFYPDQRVMPQTPGTTEISYDTAGLPSGALLLALNGGTVTGNSNAFFFIPLLRN